MLTSRIFRPTMMAGKVYAREVGSALALQSIGGVEELTLAIDEEKITQANTSSSGGGNRAVVYRINELTMTAKLQDLNPVNLARALRATASLVAASTVSNELHTARRGGLLRLAHIKPTTVAVTDAADAAIPALGNYEVLPEGLFFYDDAPDIAAEGESIKVSYAFGGYDVLQALTTAAPVLEMTFAGVNEAMEDASSVVDLYRVQMSATQGLNLITAGEFSTLDIAGEVLQDPTKSGAGVSKYFKKLMQTPA